MKLLGALISILLPGVAAAQSYDLRADWSTTENPHGPWGYRDGTTSMVGITDLQPGTWSSAQPAWARSGPAAGEFAAWFKSNGTESFPHEWLAGDVICHTAHRATLPQGAANVAWTSPLDGLVTVTGGVWPGGATVGGSPQRWSLWHEFVQLAGQATLTSGSRSAPVPFLTPTFDPISLEIVRGETVKVELEPRDASGSGDYVGVSLNVIVCAGVVQDPAPARLCPGGSVFLSVEGRTSYGTLTYRWRKDGVPILVTPNGHYQGVFTSTLSITNAAADVGGDYDCVVISTCSGVASRAAHVTYCPADFDCSGSLSGNDIFAFLNAWFAGDPRTNIDGVGGVSVQDLMAFLNGWFTGC